jgi:hypothetical protein
MQKVAALGRRAEEEDIRVCGIMHRRRGQKQWSAGGETWRDRTLCLMSSVMNFFDKTLRLWKVAFDAMALPNPNQLKETSLTAAPITPPMMGSRVRSTMGLGCSPRNMKEKRTENIGSRALMVCVKDTATMPSDTLVSRLPSVCTNARGATAVTVSFEVSNFVPEAANQNRPMIEPRKNWYAVAVMGK